MKIPDTRTFPAPEEGFKTAREWHIYHVFNDPEFIEQYDKIFLNSKAKKQRELADIKEAHIKELANKFSVEVEDIVVYSGVPSRYGGGISRSGGWVQYDVKTDSFLYKVSPDITKEEIVSLWNRQQEQMATKGFSRAKRKAPKHHLLLYAVFKLRNIQPPMTFKKIYSHYAEGTLPNYIDGSNDVFTSEDSLERYYDRFKPETWLRPDT